MGLKIIYKYCKDIFENVKCSWLDEKNALINHNQDE